MEQIIIELKREGTQLEADREQFGLALKTWRLRQHLTQEEVGKRIGVSRWTIIRAEKAGDITWESLYRIFAFLSEELRKEAANG